MESRSSVHARARPSIHYDNTVYVSISRLRVDAAAADDLVEAFRSRARLVDDVDGFVDLQVLQSDRDPSEVLMLSRWRDRACFAAYMRSDAHRASHGRIGPALKSSIHPQRVEHLHHLPGVTDVEHAEYEVVAE